MVRTEKDQSKKGHPTEEQANMEESKKKGENESTGLGKKNKSEKDTEKSDSQ